MSWFWKIETPKEEETDFDVAIRENQKELHTKAQQSRKQRKQSTDLLKISENALKYLEGLEKKDDNT
jgi:hypothetical protein